MVTHNHPPAASAADAFDQSHSGRMRSAAVERIYRSAFGADYPADTQPSAFYSATTLQSVVNALGLQPGHLMADLGCGHGGPGL
jgi:cyclopropane fatty-acyl-phospholipid synthase-like methyltransferase